MSLSLDELNSATHEYWKDNHLNDIFFTENVLLWLLMSRANGRVPVDGNVVAGVVESGELVDGGTKIRVFLEYGKANVGRYGSTVTISSTKQSIVNAARFDWGGYYASNILDFNDKVQNSGKEALIDLSLTKLRNIEKSIRDQMGENIYSALAGTVGQDAGFSGLADLFSTVTSTKYGDIAEADMALWKANVITTSEAIGYKVLQTIWRTPAIGQSRSAKPNVGITTEVLKDGFERTLQTQQRFAMEKLVNAGFDNVLFKTAPIIADDNQASGVLDALNTRFLNIRTHKDYQFTTPTWEPLAPTTPDKLVANCRWVGQLVCSNRKAHCRHTNLSEPS